MEQRRFVADAAHELRTPLAGMTTALEVARRHPQTSPTLTEDLLDSHRRLGRLVNDLLILAAVDGRAPQRAEPVDLAGVVTDCSRRPVPQRVSVGIGRLDRVFVLGDETQLGRVVSNLVDNALRYAASTVELSVRQDGGHAVVSVSDDGPGIPAADRERVWERFTRLDDDRSRASGGSGLGLAMVKELTAAHGGTASVAGARPGPGAVFLVRLPVMTAERSGAVGHDPALPGVMGHNPRTGATSSVGKGGLRVITRRPAVQPVRPGPRPQHRLRHVPGRRGYVVSIDSALRIARQIAGP